MFPELNGIIGTDSGSLEGKFLQVIENGSDSSFVLHHYLSSYLRQGLNVCMVLFNQSLGHYTSIGNKLYISLTKAIEEKNLFVVEGLKELGKTLSVDEEAMEGSLINFSAGKGNSLRPLFMEVKKLYEFSIKDQPTLVIIDDLSILLSLGIPSTDIYFFMRYLQGMTSQNGALLSILHSMIEDDEACSLSKQLFHLCDVCVQVKGLPTGHCKDVHGEMAVTSVRPDAVGNCGSRKMQFKIMDKSVSFFPLGTSEAVL